MVFLVTKIKKEDDFKLCWRCCGSADEVGSGKICFFLWRCLLSVWFSR